MIHNVTMDAAAVNVGPKKRIELRVGAFSTHVTRAEAQQLAKAITTALEEEIPQP